MDRLHELHTAAAGNGSEPQRDTADAPQAPGGNARKGRGNKERRSAAPSTTAEENDNETLFRILACFRNITALLQTVRDCEAAQREHLLTGNAFSPVSGAIGEETVGDEGGSTTMLARTQEAFQAAQSNLLTAYKLRPQYWEETNSLKRKLATLNTEQGIVEGEASAAREQLERRIRQREERASALEEVMRYSLDQLWTAERHHRDLLISDVARQLRVRLQATAAQPQASLIAPHPSPNEHASATAATGSTLYLDLDVVNEVTDQNTRKTDGDAMDSSDQQLSTEKSKIGEQQVVSALTVGGPVLTDEELFVVAGRLVDQAQCQQRGADGGVAGGVTVHDTQVFSLSAHELELALETRAAVLDIEARMRQLHQLFSDVSVLVQEQGGQLDCIAKQTESTRNAATRGRYELRKAKHYRRSCGCGVCCTIM